MITGILSPGINQLGREAYHSVQSNAGIKKGKKSISTTPYVFMAWCLIHKAQGQFYFYLYFHSFQKNRSHSHPASYPLGTVAYFTRAKEQGREAGPLTSSKDSQHEYHFSRSIVT
jgi:hypothetical protein